MLIKRASQNVAADHQSVSRRPIAPSSPVPITSSHGHDFSTIPVHFYTKAISAKVDTLALARDSTADGVDQAFQDSEESAVASGISSVRGVHIARIQPSTFATTEFNKPGIMGLAWPEQIRPKLTAHRSLAMGEPVWRAKLIGAVGWYSVQTRLLPGQLEVTGTQGNTTKDNFCCQVTQLKALAKIDPNLAANENCPPASWYKLAAVRAHEAVHVSHFQPSLRKVLPALEKNFDDFTEPIILTEPPRKPRHISRAEAVGRITRSPVFSSALFLAYRSWKNEIDAVIEQDHATKATDDAEHKIVDPVVNNICTYAASTFRQGQGWKPCPACSPTMAVDKGVDNTPPFDNSSEPRPESSPR